jgi:hypothetical protein
MLEFQIKKGFRGGRSGRERRRERRRDSVRGAEQEVKRNKNNCENFKI